MDRMTGRFRLTRNLRMDGIYRKKLLTALDSSDAEVCTAMKVLGS